MRNSNFKVLQSFKVFGLKKYLFNTSWLILDKALGLLVAFIVGVYVARYLGVYKFGQFNYALSIITILSPLSQMGVHNIYIKYLNLNPDREREITGTVFFIKLFGVASLLLLVFLISYFFISEYTTKILLIVMAIGMCFDSFQVISLFFNAKVKAKYATISNFSSNILYSIFRSLLIFINSSLMFFAVAFSFQKLAKSCIDIFIYIKKGNSIRKWKFDRVIAKEIFKRGLPLFFSGIAAVLYVRTDQIMLNSMLGAEAVGNYSIAIRLSELCFIFPALLGDSLFPALVNSSNKEILKTRFEGFFTVLLYMGLVMSLLLSLLSPFLINVLYGKEYIDAISALSVMAWNIMFAALGVGAFRWSIMNNITKYEFYRTGLGFCINVILNLVLIPRMGILGAAISSLITRFIADFAFDLVFAKTRPLFFLKLRAIYPSGFMKNLKILIK